MSMLPNPIKVWRIPNPCNKLFEFVFLIRWGANNINCNLLPGSHTCNCHHSEGAQLENFIEPCLIRGETNKTPFHRLNSERRNILQWFSKFVTVGLLRILDYEIKTITKYIIIPPLWWRKTLFVLFCIVGSLLHIPFLDCSWFFRLND